MTAPPPPAAPEGGVRDEVARAICCPLGCNGGHGSGCVSYQVADVAVQVIAIVQRAPPPLAAQAGAPKSPEDVAAEVVEQFEIWLIPYVRAHADADVAQSELCRMIAEAVKDDRSRRPWFLIDTAPTDSTPFLARYRWLGKHRFMVIHRCDAGPWWQRDGSTQLVGLKDGRIPDPVQFTHWQPLPAPPADAMGDERGK